MKSLKTEINVEDEENDENNKRYSYRNIQTTDINHCKSQSFDIFLDYAFRKKKIFIHKVKNKTKMMNYCYELEQTISINLEILQNFFNNSNKKDNNKKIIITNDSKSKDTAESETYISAPRIIQLIKNIREKVKKKSEMKKNINNLISKINDRVDSNKKYYLKIREEKMKFKQKISKINNALDNTDNYIIVMNKKFYKIQKHVDKILIGKTNKILNSKKNIYDFIYSYIENNKKINNLKKDIKKYYCEVTDIQIDNEFIKEEKKLYSNKNNYDLIRCMEFYRRTNFDMCLKLKSIKKRFLYIEKIMDYLSLGNIVQFTKKKADNDSNFEIEFSKINKENSIVLFPKFNNNSNFSIALDD
jgi:hypothetical protein